MSSSLLSRAFTHRKRSQRTKRRNRSKALTVQALEARRLLAVDITYVSDKITPVSNTHLTLPTNTNAGWWRGSAGQE